MHSRRPPAQSPCLPAAERRTLKDVDRHVRAVVPMQRHNGVFCADQDDAFHERAGVVAAAYDCGEKRAEQVPPAFTAFEEIRLLLAGKHVLAHGQLSLARVAVGRGAQGLG